MGCPSLLKMCLALSMVCVSVLVHQGSTSLSPSLLPLRCSEKSQSLHRRSPNVGLSRAITDIVAEAASTVQRQSRTHIPHQRANSISNAPSTSQRPVLMQSKIDPFPSTSKSTASMQPKGNSPPAMSEKARGKQPERPLPPQPLYPTQSQLNQIISPMPKTSPPNALEKEVKMWGSAGAKDPSKTMSGVGSSSGVASRSSVENVKMPSSSSSSVSHTVKGGVPNPGVSGSGNAAGQGLPKAADVTTMPPVTPVRNSPPASAASPEMRNGVPRGTPETAKVTNNGMANPEVAHASTAKGRVVAPAPHSIPSPSPSKPQSTTQNVALASAAVVGTAGIGAGIGVAAAEAIN